VSDEDAVDPDIAADVTYALQQVVENGSGTAAQALGRPVAGKTGTATNSVGDVVSAWFTGYTPQLSTSVVYLRGKGNGRLDGWLPSYFGGDYPAETWTAVMRRAMEGLPVEEFPEPVFVDGEAPDDGHEPTPTAPPTTRKPSPTRQPTTQQPTQEPTTQQPTPTPTTQPPSPTDSCEIITCPSESPSESPTPSEQPSPSDGQSRSPRDEAVRERQG
jgi:membrane peptidoglycan carboxypeptidase